MGRADSGKDVWRLAQNVLGNFASKSVLNQIAVSKIVDLLVLDVMEYLWTSHTVCWDDSFHNWGDSNVLCQSTKDVTVELNCINQCVCLVGILTWLGSQP